VTLTIPCRPPEVINAGSVVLSRNSVEDAADLVAAMTESLAHLRPWMPWATDQNATMEAQVPRLGEVWASWDAGTDFVYVLRLLEGDAPVVGVIGMHRRIGPRSIEIGYWTHAAHIGRGYMSAAAKAATEAAAELADVDRVEIHTDVANVRSAAIPRKLGYRLHRTEPCRPEAPGCAGLLQIWVWP
jgi:RimJ/RimL family protein N-acetyltransferase